MGKKTENTVVSAVEKTEGYLSFYYERCTEKDGYSEGGIIVEEIANNVWGVSHSYSTATVENGQVSEIFDRKRDVNSFLKRFNMSI